MRTNYKVIKLRRGNAGNRRLSGRARSRHGLVLLLALGMLALFSLLAVTYVVAASSSRAGSQAMKVRANTSNTSARGMAGEVMRQALRGTRDPKSSFFKHALLEDIYDANAIRVQFGHRIYPQINNTFLDSWALRLTPTAPQTGVEIVKLSLDPRNPDLLGGPVPSYRLNPIENAYNTRVITILEGPLAGYSFRILKYVGYVRSSLGSDPPDPNTPSNPTYTRNDAFEYDYSIAIDLSSVRGSLEGRWKNPNTGLTENFSGDIAAWLNLPNGKGLRNLFYFYDPASDAYQGFKCVINGAAFNNAGIGFEDVPGEAGFGNIDSRRVMAIPSAANRKISPALLPHYDYIQRTDMMATEPGTGIAGIPTVGDLPRLRPTQNLLRGQSNEGYDVPDWRDFWLANVGFTKIGNSVVPNIIPSFHRPELINYIANLFGDPQNLSAGEVYELLRMIDASTARLMSYSFGSAVENPYFSPGVGFPKLPTDFTWSTPQPTPAEVLALQGYVRALINGPWDVDNDGDGIRESVWINPNLPTMHSPDGKLLKPLASIHIEDLDGRLNINLHGDRIHGSIPNNGAGQQGFNAFTDNAGFLRADLAGTTPFSISQGFGFGPADISLNQLFGFNSLLLTSSQTSFSIFDDRYGARRYRTRPIVYSAVDLDRSPGLKGTGAFDGDDLISVLRYRETRYVDPAVNGQYVHGRSLGTPMGRRGSIAPAFDRNGNLAFVHPTITDAYPDTGASSGIASERVGDAYEAGTGAQPNADTPFTLAELEAVLRRFDDDVEVLPDYLRERLVKAGFGSTSEVNRLLTTHSAELRYPKLAAAATIASPTGIIAEKDAGNLLGLIRMLHEQRYRKRTLPAGAPDDDPQLSLESLYELFPPEFSSNLRMDLNRPFGNGVDDAYTTPNGNEVANGEVDDPRELLFSNERELKILAGTVQASAASGFYDREQRDANSASRPYLGSRQLMARYLYCLAQLIIPRDYEFPSMKNVNDALNRHKLRARAIAQWAVNVVDFRDGDGAMTRFEYDIFPFGINDSGLGINRQAYWAPDRLMVYNASNNSWAPDATQRPFIGVVFGMENPELLLTESIALHDKSLRDTDLDDGPGKATNDAMTPDPNMDQYRFPKGSLYLELYAPRTTYVPEDKKIPGVPSSLYDIRANTAVRLNIGKLAPSSAYWGSQPVWRIGINPMTSPGSTGAAQQPNAVYQDADPSKMDKRDFQFSKNAAVAGDPTSSIPEVNLGNGLLTDFSTMATTGLEFERMIWFTTQEPNTYNRIPNLEGNDNTNDQNPQKRHKIYYNRTQTTGDDVLLDGGSYLVLGPRTETVIGSLTNNPDDGTPWSSRLLKASIGSNRPINSPSHQSITLKTDSVLTTLLNGESVFRYRPEWSNAVKTPKGIVCAADVPSESPLPPAGSRWADCFQNGVGMNISMPNPIAGQGYWTANRKPLSRLNSDDLLSGRSDDRYGYGDTLIPPDSWVDCKAAPVGQFPDEPFDYSATINPVLNSAGGNAMNKTGTYPNVRTAFLQRLADPNMPYDPVNNPYITVDWISIDLTVFNGEAPQADDPEDNGGGTIAFQSRYKDGGTQQTAATKGTIDTNANQPATRTPKDWGYSYNSVSTARLRKTAKQNLVQPQPAGAGPQGARYNSYFMYQLGYTMQQPPDAQNNQPKHHSATTLGYVNVGYRFDSISGSTNDTADQFDGFGPPQAVTGNPLYNGSPRDLTSLVWLNRPFASSGELMLVPLTSPGQFGTKHGIAKLDAPRNPFDFLPSFQNANPMVTNLEDGAPSDLNAFTPQNDTPSTRNNIRLGGYWMQRAGNWPTGSAKPPVQADWAMLLEFVETTPPWIDSAKFLDPEKVQTASTANNVAARFLASYLPANYTGNGEQDSQRGVSIVAPRNNIPNYVSAGKINLNTMTMQSSGRVEALQGIEHLFLTGTQRAGSVNDSITDWFMLSRRGYASGTPSSFFGGTANAAMDPNYPSQFAGAYRSGLATNLYPLAPYPGAADNNNMPLVVQRGRYSIESGILRSVNPNPVGVQMPSTTNVGNLLFSPDSVIGSEVSNIPGAAAQEVDDAKRNPFTRYQRAMRLPNLVTDQSNVFAVWVTVSLFEYDPITGFGREYVNASGDAERERAFYIIDRTVPVGFIPGEDINTEKTILLERRINGGRR